MLIARTLYVVVTLTAGAALVAGCSGGGGSSSPITGIPPFGTQASTLTRTTESLKNPSFQVIYNFQGYKDGASPQSTLIYTNGKFYGTTYGLKPNGQGTCGTVFSLTPNANFTAFTETVLHSFTGKNGDGCHPKGGVIAAGSNIYGATFVGGTSGAGTVFSIPMTGGPEQVLYSFGTGSTDAIGPNGPLLNVGSNLYGVTVGGGAANDGAVYSVSLTGGSDTVLYSFQGQPDGLSPIGGLINVGSNVYGVTSQGGTMDLGTVFSVPLAGGQDTVLSSFTTIALPFAGLTNVGSNLYGTTLRAVYSVPLTGGPAVILHQFTEGLDGDAAESPLTLIGNDLYGTTVAGGAVNGRPSGFGTVYKVPIAGGSDKLLYSFVRGEPYYPIGGVIDVNGSLYGTLSRGGPNYTGAVFKL